MCSGLSGIADFKTDAPFDYLSVFIRERLALLEQDFETSSVKLEIEVTVNSPHSYDIVTATLGYSLCIGLKVILEKLPAQHKP